jgi:hypothetical protein
MTTTIVVKQPKILVQQGGQPTTVVVQDGASGFVAPGRTLFVANSWKPGSDPSTCFTDPTAALVVAAALNPPPDVNNPAAIVFYPGLYDQPLTLVSNVHLCGHSARGCTITGAVTYNPGVGVNASQAALFERVYVSNMGISGPLTIDATGKSSGQQTTFDCRSADISGNVVHRGRASQSIQDVFETWDGVHGGTWLFDGSVVAFRSGAELNGASLTLTNCTIGGVFAGCRIFAPLTLVNSLHIEGSGSKFVDVNVDETSSFGPIPGGKTGVVTVEAGGSADLRGAEYLTATNLAGAGSIDRSLWRTAFGPTAVGDNTIMLSPAYIDANYNVHITQTAGTPSPITISGKQHDQFTLSDAAGGNTFDITIVKE